MQRVLELERCGATGEAGNVTDDLPGPSVR